VEIQGFAEEIDKTGYLTITAEDHSGIPKDDHLIVFNNKDNQKYKVLLSTVCSYDWQNLKRVLDGGEAKIMDQMTRIVGYYSRVSNWNKSKLGELGDRRKGDYKIGI